MHRCYYTFFVKAEGFSETEKMLHQFKDALPSGAFMSHLNIKTPKDNDWFAQGNIPSGSTLVLTSLTLTLALLIPLFCNLDRSFIAYSRPKSQGIKLTFLMQLSFKISF
jgi:hypothetical protein